MTARIQGTFTGAGESAVSGVLYSYNVSLVFAANGSVDLRRSFDAGATWETLRTITQASTAAEKFFVGSEPELRVLYKFVCSSASGNINYRLGSDGLPA